MPDRTPEDMPDRTPKDMPDRTPEDMPDGTPKDMPGRMRNYLIDRIECPKNATWNGRIYVG